MVVQAVELFAQDGPGGYGNGLVGRIQVGVAEDKGGAVEPGELAEGGEIGYEVDVTVA